MAIVIAGTMIARGALAQSATPAPPAPPAAPQGDFDQKFIGFDDYGVIDPDTGQFRKVTELYEGKYKKSLAPLDFYRLVGREDLAQEYQRRDARRTLLMGAGAVVALGALAASTAILFAGQPEQCTVATGFPTPGDFAAFSACVSRSSDEARSAHITAAAVGAGGLVLGGVLLLAGAATDPNPVDLPQMRALADQYNQKLKTGMRVVPFASPSEAGVALDLRF
jgi:hypothetical protein